MSNLRSGRAQDWAFKEAKALGYVARSALKLREINQRFRVVRHGGAVLDLGCAPGAWLQVACQALGASAGTVLGVDLQAVALPLAFCDSRVRTLQSDVLSLSSKTLLDLHSPGFTVVLSDLAPATTGASGVDAARSERLALAALELAVGDDHGGVLRRGGSLVVKLLEGPGGGVASLTAAARPLFSSVRWFRPKATRPESAETFLIAQGLLRGVQS